MVRARLTGFGLRDPDGRDLDEGPEAINRRLLLSLGDGGSPRPVGGPVLAGTPLAGLPRVGPCSWFGLVSLEAAAAGSADDSWFWLAAGHQGPPLAAGFCHEPDSGHHDRVLRGGRLLPLGLPRCAVEFRHEEEWIFL